MVHRPVRFGAFEFVTIATLRAQQLMRGCIPKVDDIHKPIMTAQYEVVAGKVVNVGTFVTKPSSMLP